MAFAKGCDHSPYDASGENLQRRYLMVMMNCSDSTNLCPINFGTANQYIKSFKVLTCANWQQSSATGMCSGTTLNGSGFYQ